MASDVKANANEMSETMGKDCVSLLMKLMPTLNEASARSIRRGDFPWDSLKHIEVINEIEAKFGVQLTADAALRLNDLNSMVAIVLGLKSSI